MRLWSSLQAAVIAWLGSATSVGVPGPATYYHGVYPGEAGLGGEEDALTSADVEVYEQAAGRTVAWVYFSHNWYRSRAFPSEFGVSAGNRRCDAAAWADQALAALLSDRWTAVRGFSWWNERWQNDDDPAHDSDMRVQTVPGLAEVFRSRLATPKVIDRPLSGS